MAILSYENDILTDGRNLEMFRVKVQMYSKLVAKGQKDLANKLGFSRSFFCRKLNNADGACLTHLEVKTIIKALAEWQAINTQAEAIELLGFMNLSSSSFSLADWNSYPLNELETNTNKTLLENFPTVPVEDIVTLQLDSKTARAVANILRLLRQTNNNNFSDLTFGS